MKPHGPIRRLRLHTGAGAAGWGVGQEAGQSKLANRRRTYARASSSFSRSFCFFKAWIVPASGLGRAISSRSRASSPACLALRASRWEDRACDAIIAYSFQLGGLPPGKRLGAPCGRAAGSVEPHIPCHAKRYWIVNGWIAGYVRPTARRSNRARPAKRVGNAQRTCSLSRFLP